LCKAGVRLQAIALAILVVCIAILVMYDTGWVTGMAGWAQVRLWAVVRSAGNAGRGPVRLVTLWDTLSHCIAIGDLGRQFGDFSIPGCDKLEGNGSEVCHRSENSVKLILFRIRGPVK
jgi:hypothetical protein